MAKEKKTEDTYEAPSLSAALNALERIECARVKFVRAYTGPPSKKVNDLLTSRKLRKDSEFELYYLPRLRQFEVIHVPRGQEDLAQPWMVPEAQVERWEVLETALSRGEHR